MKKNGDRFTIMAGERRYSAAKIANRTTIPCIVKETEDFEFISLIENIQRKDLDTIEECIAVKNLVDKGLRVVEVAGILGKSHTYISKAVKIAKFAERHGEIDKLSGATMADGRKLGLEHLLYIASQPTLEQSCALLGEIRDKSITVPVLRAMKKPLAPQGSDLHRRLFSTRSRFDLSFLRSVQNEEVDGECLKELELIQTALAEAQLIVEKLLLRCRKINESDLFSDPGLLTEGSIGI